MREHVGVFGRGSAEIAGFIDDSLVVVTDCREWYEDTETWNGGYYSDVSCGHDRMMVYNYRVQENGPRWSDSLTNKSNGYHWYQMTDSVFWRWEGDNILLWKVGEKAHEMKLSRKNDGCSESFKIDRIRQWLNGKFIALGGKFDADGENCQYAVLDTNVRTLTFKRLEKSLEWIKECDDVRAWEDEVYCVEKSNDETGFYLKVNENKEDSVDVANVINISSLWSSFEFEFTGEMIYFGHNINTIDYKNRKIKIYPNVKATSAFNYVDEDDNNVNYEWIAK